jgi:hypothetical protein
MNELRFCKPKAVYFEEVKFTIGILEVEVFNAIRNLDNFTHQDLSNLFSNSFSAQLNNGLKDITYNLPFTSINAAREINKLHTITISVNNDNYLLVILTEQK